MKTQAYWRNYNMAFRDKDYSPQKGVSLWETCPQLASLDPGVGITYMEDFFAWTTADWTQTIIGVGGAVGLQNGKGGILRLTTDVLDDDGVQIQKKLPEDIFIPAAAKPLWFEAKMQLVTAAKHVESEFLIGLAITDTTVIPGVNDGIFFQKADATAEVGALTEIGGVATTTPGVLTFAPATWYKFGFWCDGITTCYLYVDGVLVATHTTHIPIVAMQPTFAVLNGEAGAVEWDIDYFKIFQIR